MVAILTKGRADTMRREAWQAQGVLADLATGRLVWQESPGEGDDQPSQQHQDGTRNGHDADHSEADLQRSIQDELTRAFRSFAAGHQDSP
jgi:hypothetical protein